MSENNWLESDIKAETTTSGNISLGSTILYFTLTPNKPSESADAISASSSPWKLTYNPVSQEKIESANITQSEGGFTIHFKADNVLALDSLPESVKQVVIAKQQAIFIVDINNENTEDDWRFYENGLILDQAQNHFEYSFKTEVINSGKTMVITISNVIRTTGSNGVDNIDFRFAAVNLNANGPGKLDGVYYSQDPRIALDRG